MDTLKNKKEKLIIIILELVFQSLTFITYLYIYFIKLISCDYILIILEGYKMKRILLMILLIFTTILTSCGFGGYSGNYSDLYSVAINSVLWLNGYSWGADYECDPIIEVIEEDSYGRTMFRYYEKY